MFWSTKGAGSSFLRHCRIPFARSLIQNLYFYNWLWVKTRSFFDWAPGILGQSILRGNIGGSRKYRGFGPTSACLVRTGSFYMVQCFMEEIPPSCMLNVIDQFRLDLDPKNSGRHRWKNARPSEKL